MKKQKKYAPVNIEIDPLAFKKYCQDMDKFAKEFMKLPMVKAMIAEKEAGH